jgi:hypothetical protein
MFSTPWSVGFVLAAILGAMLVPGCRPAGSTRLLEVSGAPAHQVQVQSVRIGTVFVAED